MNKLRINKIGLMSVAKIYAVMAFVFSLIFAVPYGLMIIVFSLVGGAAAGQQDALGGLAFGGGGVIMGLMVLIGIPVFYSIMGFVGGIIAALIYNIFAGIVGGIEISVERID